MWVWSFCSLGRKKCALGKNSILKFLKIKIPHWSWWRGSCFPWWLLESDWMGKAGVSLRQPPSPGTSPCLGFPQQQHLGTEPKTSTSFSCHSPLGSQGISLLRTFPRRQGDCAWAAWDSAFSLCSCFSKCPSLPPLVLVGVSAPGFTLTLFFLLFSLLLFYLRIPNLFINSPSF